MLDAADHWSLTQRSFRSPDERPGVDAHRAGLPGWRVDIARGCLDPLALSVPDQAFLYEVRDRLVHAGVSGGEITDFGVALSLDFSDPDGATPRS
jgi:hypothetical protein